MLANSAARPGSGASAHSKPALVASRQARSRAFIPNGRAGLDPTGINRRGASLDIASRINARNRAGKGRRGLSLARNSHFAHKSARMADLDQSAGDEPHGSVYRV